MGRLDGERPLQGYALDALELGEACLPLRLEDLRGFVDAAIGRASP